MRDTRMNKSQHDGTYTDGIGLTHTDYVVADLEAMTRDE